MQSELDAIAGSMVQKANAMCRYDWWQAGRAAGTAPSVADMVQYGTVHAEGWYSTGVPVSECVLRGVKAMYRFAYDEVRDSIVKRGARGNATSATSVTEMSSIGASVEHSGLFETLDWVARSGLREDSKRAVALWLLGYRVRLPLVELRKELS